MEWIDSELNTHSGSYFMSFYPEYKFNFYNEEYKVNKVIKATFRNKKSELTAFKEYDNEGFLIAEMRYNNTGNKELHQYDYRQNRHLIIDSIIHIIARVDSIMFSPVKPVKKDTVYHTEKRYFDVNNRLSRGYNVFSNAFYKSYLKERAFYPDSFFYHYDHCGNCDQLIWYTDGGRNEKTQKYHYTNTGSPINVDHPDGYGSEVWKFNADTQLTEIFTDYEHIIIKYNQAKKVNLYQYVDIKFSYVKRDPSPTLYKKTTYYYYDNKRCLLKVRTHRENQDPSLNEDKWVILKRYNNGLFQRDFSGNVIYYTYKNKK